MALPGLIQKAGWLYLDGYRRLDGSSWMNTEGWMALPGLIQKAGWLYLD
jgi:hypothetical protein